MKYVIAGTGGVGGSLAAFLSLAGKDVTCVARGTHLETIRKSGLHLISGLKGTHTIRIKACEAEEYKDKADVIFVCVKGYSIDSILNLIRNAAHEKTIVIPILNVYGTGPKLQQSLPGVTVLDGCVYIVGFISNPGEITQMGNVFRIVFGAHEQTKVSEELLRDVQNDLTDSGIKAEISDDINRDTFIKWSFISAMACTGAYFNVQMGEVQKPGKIRDTFIALSTESAKLGEKSGIRFNENMVAYNLKVLDKLDPHSTASMQKDLEKGNESEIQGLLFDMLALAKEYEMVLPTYEKIALKFSKQAHGH